MSRRLRFLAGALVSLVALAGCSASDSPGTTGGKSTGGGGTGNTGVGGTGNTGVGGTGNTGGGGTGNTGGGGTGNTGGGGTGNTGVGGTGNTGGGGTENTGGSAGTGDGGSGNTGGSTSSTDDAGSCPDEVKAATPGTPDSCASCLCDQCNAEVMQIKADGKPAADLIACAVANNCDGDCCFCKNDGHVCSTTSCGDYGNGPCAKETNVAATGKETTNCYTEGTMLGMLCKQSGNACGDTTLLSICERSKCMTECAQQAPVCLP